MATLAVTALSDISATGTWSQTEGERYLFLADYPSTDTTDILVHGTLAGALLMGVQTFQFLSIPSGSTINAVRVKYYNRDSTNGTNNMGSQIRVNGTVYNSATHNPSTTVTLRTDSWTTNPNTGVAWTRSDIDLIDGFGLRSTDANPTIWITSAALEIDYTPPPTIEQKAYGFYAYGTESSASIYGSQSTALSRNKNADPSTAALRVMLQETAAGVGLATDDYTLLYSHNGSAYTSIASNVYTPAQSGYNAAETVDLTTTTTGLGKSFIAPISGYLDSVKMTSYGAFASSKIRIYAHTGTFGVNGLPTGSALASSSEAVNDGGAGFGTAVTFSFPSGQRPTLTMGTPYFMVVEYVADEVFSIFTASSPNNTGNGVVYEGGGWSVSSFPPMMNPSFVMSSGQFFVNPYSAAGLTEGQATTNRLTGGTGTFLTGEVSLDGIADNFQLTANNYTEMLYGIQFGYSNLADGDQITFRVERAPTGSSYTYTQVPTINITAPAVTDTSKMMMMFY